MLKEEIRKILSSRIALNYNDDANIEKYWRLEVELFKMDVCQTISFIDNDCTPDEFDWFSEIFEELAALTQSKGLVESLFRFIINHPDCLKMPGVYEHCLYAEGAIEDEGWNCPLKQNTERMLSDIQ